MTNFSSLRLKTIVMHQIRKNSGESEFRFRVHLTDEAIVMEPDDQAFLTRRFVKALSGRGIAVMEDRTLPDVVPSEARGIWSDESRFIEHSKDIALHLASVQPGSALEGLLVVALGDVSGDEFILISKVEHQEAMRLEPVTNADGHQVFEIERIRDLVFGDTARIYKIGILSKALSSTGVLSGELVDDQNGNRFADYFLGRFLGMRLQEEPSVLTERFLDSFTKAINASSMPAERKLDTQSALVAELQSNAHQVSPEGFIRNHVPSGFGPEIREIAVLSGATFGTFTKDTTRITNHISRIRMEMANGVLVIAPPDEIGEGKAVTVDSTNDGDLVTISGSSVVSVKPTGGR